MSGCGCIQETHEEAGGELNNSRKAGPAHHRLGIMNESIAGK